MRSHRLLILRLIVLLCVVIGMDTGCRPERQVSTRIVVGVISTYQQTLSGRIPLIRCRHEESCSHYCKRAFRERGFVPGVIASLRRLQSCF